MIRHFYIYFLAAVIAMQSVAVMADVHTLHQPDSNHLSFEDKQPENSQTLLQTDKEKFNTNTINISDCHHCCHCHGSAHMFINGSQSSLVHSHLYSEVDISSTIDYRSHIIPTVNPPPIYSLSY